MACKNCESVWTTKNGNDCKTCPYCCKLQRSKARKDGRWIEPTQKKTCEECGAVFAAVGLHNIAIQVLCESQGCKASRRKRQRKASFMRITEGVCTLPRRQKQKRHCQRLGCGKELICRDQKHYCGKPCYFAAIREGKQQFKGRVRDEWAALVDWAYGWDAQRPRARKAMPRKARPECQHCGKECSEGARRFCSRSCTQKWRGKRKCRCGNVVVDASAYSRPSCDECKRESKRIQKRMYGSYRKRCRAYGGFFNKAVVPKAVFDRDKWKCHICGKKTHKVYRTDDSRSATVDHHPIPLSKGGDHDWHNVRCACSMCNAIKGNNWDGQRRLQLEQT